MPDLTSPNAPTVSGAARLLIVDDEPGICYMLKLLLERFGYHVETATDPDAATLALEAGAFDVVISDMRMGEEAAAGIRLLQTMQLRWPQIPVVLLTAHADVRTTIQAVNHRAYRFLEKPPQQDELLEVVRSAVALSASQQMLAAIEPTRPASLLGSAPLFRRAVSQALTAAATDVTVLVRGETGTGKEVLARAIHAASPRAAGAFQALNCGAISPTLLESLLFGHVRGAFTDAKESNVGLLRAAAGGTVFLDEIGDMPLELQIKLLRVIQEKEVLPVGALQAVPVDVRFIAATHRELLDEVAAGRFREDLYYRLATIDVVLPALRDRPDDIVLLARSALQRIWVRLGRTGRPPPLGDTLTARLLAYDWPGNIRELEHVLERLVVLSPGRQFQMDLLPESMHRAGRRPPQRPVGRMSAGGARAEASVDGRGEEEGGALGAGSRATDRLATSPVDQLPRLAIIEEAYCLYVVGRTNGAKGRAAGILGIDPNTLARKLKPRSARRDDVE